LGVLAIGIVIYYAYETFRPRKKRFNIV
jgi:hypothetical protein